MPEIIITEDGSHSLFNKALDETYHSIHGAIQESQHVFINNGLNYFKNQTDRLNIHILEIGFGTGLNALLTLMQSSHYQQHIQYTTLEACPLQEEIWSVLNYGNKLDAKEEFKSLHSTTWNTWHTLKDNFSFIKIKDTLQQVALLQNNFDIIYFDAFAPAKQPEMWTIEMLNKITGSIKPGGIFVTYCAKGQLKRDLKALGLRVEILAGPPGKREMVRALKD